MEKIKMFEYTDEEILQMENTISSRIPFDNAYFMSVYTTCKEILDTTSGVNAGVCFARICEGLDFCGEGGSFKSEQYALLALLDTSVDTKKLQPLATTRNTVINGLNYILEKQVRYLTPTQYVNALADMINKGMKELFIACMCDLIACGKELLKNGKWLIKDDDTGLFTDVTYRAHAMSLAYLDTLIDMSNFRLEGHMFEARNRFGIVAGKLRKKFDI